MPRGEILLFSFEAFRMDIDPLLSIVYPWVSFGRPFFLVSRVIILGEVVSFSIFGKI